jgi:hypothetical protein
MLASFLLLVDLIAVSWEGVKFRGRACQRRDFEKISNETIFASIIPQV